MQKNQNHNSHFDKNQSIKPRWVNFDSMSLAEMTQYQSEISKKLGDFKNSQNREQLANYFELLNSIEKISKKEGCSKQKALSLIMDSLDCKNINYFCFLWNIPYEKAEELKSI